MHIFKCQVCNKYQLSEECCNQKCERATPAKYSPDDKYAHYRRQAKENVESHN